MEEKDPYFGDSKLKLTSKWQPLDKDIPVFPRHAKEDYKDMTYPSEYIPPEKMNQVELPTKEKDKEPEINPPPKVKQKVYAQPPLPLQRS